MHEYIRFYFLASNLLFELFFYLFFALQIIIKCLVVSYYACIYFNINVFSYNFYSVSELGLQASRYN